MDYCKQYVYKYLDDMEEDERRMLRKSNNHNLWLKHATRIMNLAYEDSDVPDALTHDEVFKSMEDYFSHHSNNDDLFEKENAFTLVALFMSLVVILTILHPNFTAIALIASVIGYSNVISKTRTRNEAKINTSNTNTN